MKKTFKKLFAVLLAAALVLAMAVPAFAATNTGNNGTIEIENTVSNETYAIYRMFTLDSYDGDSYSYTVEPAWAPFFEGSAAGADYITLTNGHPTWKDGVSTDKDTTVAEFAKKALDWAEKYKVPSVDTKDGNGSTISFAGLPLGYYLVNSSLGALCNLTTTNNTATIHEKNEVPTLTKEIVDVNGNKVDESTAKIGDTVYYKIEITVAKGTKNYVLSDTMSEGLTFNNNSLTVASSNSSVSVSTSDYNVNPDGNSFTLSFTDDFVSRVGAGNTIIITYNATLNEKAVVGTSGNTNSATLTYGDNQSVTKTTTTTTYEFDLIKVDGSTKKLLDGAQFKLYAVEAGGEAIKVVPVTGGYRVANGDETGATELIAVTNGKVRISGLDKTTYWLEETKAPDGYNALTERQEVSLNSGSNNTDMSGDTWVDGNHGVVVENNAGTILPGTGGMGTTLFYVIGGGLMIAAVVLLITKKRMERKN